MLLYNSAVSGNCYKVRLLLAQLGLEYETVDVSVVDRSNRQELLGDLNPALRVPTLVLDDGRPLPHEESLHALGVSNGTLGWDDLSELEDRGVRIESHGIGHRPLSELDRSGFIDRLYAGQR